MIASSSSCFHVVYAKFWPYHLTVARKIKTHQNRQRFGELVWIVASVSCSLLTGVAPGVSSAAVAHLCQSYMLCIQRCSYAYLWCKEWLFELLLPFYLLKSVWLFSSDLWHQQRGISPTELPLTGYFCFFWKFSVNPWNGCVWKSQ